MKKDFKTFVVKMAVFSSPLVILIICLILLDPFKVWFNYSEYYKNNFVTLNRELVCLKLFDRNIKNAKYNSYIFGSSRSQAYRIPEWQKYLDSNARGFHFDASGESIYGIYHKIKYIKSKNLPIDNTLIVLDANILSSTKNRKGYLFISPPELSGESKLAFIKEFLIANLDRSFVIGYLDYRIFHHYKNYMKTLFNKAKYDHVSDNLTGDLYYGYDKMIQENQAEYYHNLIKKRVFYKRRKVILNREKPISTEEIKLLTGIKNLLVNANYKIVISPLYDQQKLSKARQTILSDIFGSENIYDYSGKNTYTESIYNYYEAIHYRPVLANQIMQEIYSK